MSQSYVMPREQFEAQGQFSNLIHKQLIGDRVLATEVFTGPRVRDLHDAMDARLKAIEAAGGALIHRAKIGRNTPCPCGSGLKFKKCCIDKAEIVG